jgi:hypothetical protein
VHRHREGEYFSVTPGDRYASRSVLRDTEIGGIEDGVVDAVSRPAVAVDSLQSFIYHASGTRRPSEETGDILQDDCFREKSGHKVKHAVYGPSPGVLHASPAGLLPLGSFAERLAWRAANQEVKFALSQA